VQDWESVCIHLERIRRAAECFMRGRLSSAASFIGPCRRPLNQRQPALTGGFFFAKRNGPSSRGLAGATLA
jgi:hypothetical protein